MINVNISISDNNNKSLLQVSYPHEYMADALKRVEEIRDEIQRKVLNQLDYQIREMNQMYVTMHDFIYDNDIGLVDNIIRLREKGGKDKFGINKLGLNLCRHVCESLREGKAY